ncbi:phage tail domain-containing protein [Kocuria rhizophila]|uniref:phage tail domain-containing protein n=1 Tax=Kocuria rhizophila TaxID=72000 RepID=UPI0002F64CAE|nr:phage tail domain-containing protein [Kocuria rhizophila]
MDDISRRRAELRWGDQVLTLSTFEDDREEEHHLTDLEGWYGGVGVYGTQPQRELGHGLFPRKARRTGRTLTLKGSLWFREESWRDLADRYVSGILQDGDFGTLTYSVDGFELSTRVRLDGEVKHTTKGFEWIDFEVPLSAPDPFLYAPPVTAQVSPPGAGVGFSWANGVFPGGGVEWREGRNTAARIVNEGNADAYPTVTVRGSWPNGFRLTDGRHAVEYPHAVFDQSPVTVNMRAGSVTVRGADQTHRLTKRQWFTVPPRGALTVRAEQFAPSTGWADITLQSTYI